MWVQGELADSGTHVLVTLQVLDRDPGTGNVHAIFDRLGVIPAKDAPHPALHPSKKASTAIPTTNDETEEWVKRSVLSLQYHTNIDLPLNEEKLDRLKQIIQNRCGISSDKQ